MHFSLYLQDRYIILKDKYNENDLRDSGGSGYERGVALEKSLSDALDSFDNLFCRRCMVRCSHLNCYSESMMI